MSKSRLRRAVIKAESLSGQLDGARYFDAAGGGAATARFARVMSATPIVGATARWTYTLQPMLFDPDVPPNGDFVESGPTIIGAKNLIEWNNNALGTFDCGNGVRTTSLSGGYVIKPASVGTPIVRIHRVGSQIVFQLANGTDRP